MEPGHWCGFSKRPETSRTFLPKKGGIQLDTQGPFPYSLAEIRNITGRLSHLRHRAGGVPEKGEGIGK